MYLRINGTDIMPYLIEDGLEWSRNDLDSSDAGRTMDGVMHRGRIATKIKLNITIKPLETEALSVILNLLQPEFFTVEYLDPLFGARSVRMYSNNITAKLRCRYNAESGKWDSFSVPLVER